MYKAVHLHEHVLSRLSRSLFGNDYYDAIHPWYQHVSLFAGSVIGYVDLLHVVSRESVSGETGVRTGEGPCPIAHPPRPIAICMPALSEQAARVDVGTLRLCDRIKLYSYRRSGIERSLLHVLFHLLQ